MNNACPQCGAVYAVAEKDIGRRIACKKCNTALVVSAEGLKRDDSAVLPATKSDDLPERDDDRASRKRGRTRSGAGTGAILKKLKELGDVATWLYGFGLVLTIYSFFSPAIDQAKSSARDGDLIQAQVDDSADQRDTDLRNDGKPSDEDRKRREKNKKEYDTRKRPRLEDEKRLADAAAKQSEWWNVMFRLIGFALLAFGSIAFMSGDQTNLKRILGGVTIVLILLEIVGGGVGLSIQAGRRGAG